MTRQEEWAALQTMEEPAALTGSLKRAKVRRLRGRLRRGGLSLAGAMCAFVLAVNLSVPFALACGQLPLLRGVTAAVAFDPGLKAVLKEGWYQPLEGVYTDNGVTFRTYCLMADDQRVTLVCSLDKGVAMPEELLDGTGAPVDCSKHSIDGTGKIQLLNFDLMEGVLPEELILTLSVDDHSFVGEAVGSHSGEHMADFTIHLVIESRFRMTTKVVELGKAFELDGQTLTVERLILTPSATEVIVSGAEENRAWLDDLSFYFTDEQGREVKWVGTISQGFGAAAIPDKDTPFLGRYRMPAMYFDQPEHLTMHITAARWLTKDRPDVTLDLETGKAENLPEFVDSWSVERKNGTMYLRFQLNSEEAGRVISFLSRWGDLEGATFGFETGDPNAMITLEDRGQKKLVCQVEFDKVEAVDLAVELY